MAEMFFMKIPEQSSILNFIKGMTIILIFPPNLFMADMIIATTLLFQILIMIMIMIALLEQQIIFFLLKILAPQIVLHGI